MPADPYGPASPAPEPARREERPKHPLTDPADRERAVETSAVDSPEQDVLGLDDDDYLPQPVPSQRPTP